MKTLLRATLALAVLPGLMAAFCFAAPDTSYQVTQSSVIVSSYNVAFCNGHRVSSFTSVTTLPVPPVGYNEFRVYNPSTSTVYWRIDNSTAGVPGDYVWYPLAAGLSDGMTVNAVLYLRLADGAALTPVQVVVKRK